MMTIEHPRPALIRWLAVLAVLAGCGPADLEEPPPNELSKRGATDTSSSNSSGDALSPSPAPSTSTPPAPPEPTAAASWWKPAPGTSWQWQLTGTIDTSVNATMFDIDLFTTSQATIDTLHAKGKKVVCYFSAGSYEPNRPDSSQFTTAVKGKVMDGWPNERWVDVRSATIKSIMQSRLDVAKSKGCDGVEPDNVDGYTNATGFPLTGADQITFNKFLAKEAHARGLSIALKNDLDQIPALVADFDFALDEQCQEYDECADLVPFIKAGKAVFQAEYQLSSSAVCPAANARNFDALIKKLDLNAYRVSCR